MTNLELAATAAYSTIYDSVYLTCSKKLKGSQLSLPHGIKKKIKCEATNELMSVVGPVQSHYQSSNKDKISLRYRR